MHTPVLLMPGFMILARLSSTDFMTLFAKPDNKSTGVRSQNQYLCLVQPFPKRKGALAPFTPLDI